MRSESPSVPRQRTFLGHPVGLYILFFTEMWERFSYYGMRALLMPYMVNYFLWSQKDASMAYKWYTSLVYLTPILGGYLADRYLGNKKAVIIGAVLMAVGHFLMAFETYTIFFAALIFLIAGNGFFKPNMSTQVGRLYPANDVRRDGAYTIFYMGINLGAFLSPLVCGYLAANTLGRYHTGFTMAGIGMVFGLIIYVVGIRWVVEIEEDGGMKEREAAAVGEGGEMEVGGAPPAPEHEDNESDGAMSEADAAQTPASMPAFNRMAPSLFVLIGVLSAVGGPLLAWPGIIAWNTCISMEIGAVCAFFSGWITSQVDMGLRDRVLTIFILGFFVVIFWAAFEQAGNVLNLWADKNTNRYLASDAPTPDLYPPMSPVVEKKGGEAIDAVDASPTSLTGIVNMFKPLPDTTGPKEEKKNAGFEMPTAWFQSINPLAIFVLAPLFAAAWTFLGRRNMNPSVPTKMAFGVLLTGLSFAVMIMAANRENVSSSTTFPADQIPPQIHVTKDGRLCEKKKEESAEEERCYQAGRLRIETDGQGSRLAMRGVLSDIERDRILRDTAPDYYRQAVKELAKKSNEAAKAEEKSKQLPVSIKLDKVPPGFEMRYSGFNKAEVVFDEEKQTLTTHMALADKDEKALLVAAGDPTFRDAINDLYLQSSHFKVSAWWLFWSYILATIGELCLSPVGLSMVSKLAPARFATMLMGLWLLTSFFGNFAAGAFGERWGLIPPDEYFWVPVIVLLVASAVLFLFTRKVVTMMHGVN